MAYEIEKYLLAKLSDGLNDPKLRLQSQFVDVQTALLQTKLKLRQSPNENMSKLYREKLYEVNNLVAQNKTVSKKLDLYNPADYYNISRRLNKIKQELQGETSTTGSSSGSHQTTEGEHSLPKEVEAFRWSSSSLYEKKVHGFDEEERSLVRLLLCPEKDGQFNAIGIVGMRGIGKTTLCQLVFNNPEVKKHFLPRIWVCLSKLPKGDKNNEKEIVYRMLSCLGVEEEVIKSIDEKKGLRGLIFALHLQLRGKKYLIVLDDANWNEDEEFGKLDTVLSNQDEKWGEKLGYGLPKECGGKVIVTSRSGKVAKNMIGEESVRCLLPISDEESCWNIFKDSVEKDGIKFPQERDHLKKEILNKCDGLPLAAKLMGHIMHEKLQKRNNSNHSN